MSMTFQEYQKFINWNNENVCTLLKKKLGYMTIMRPTRMTAEGLWFTLRNSFSRVVSPEIAEIRKAAGCTLLPSSYSKRIYSLSYKDNDKQQLEKELKALFPHVWIKRFFTVGEENLAVDFRVSYQDWFLFAEKNDVKPTEVYRNIGACINDLECYIQSCIKDSFGVLFPDIEIFGENLFQLNVLFCDIEPEELSHIHPKIALMSDGYSAALEYSDKNQQAVKEILRELFPGFEVDTFRSIEFAQSKIEGKHIQRYALALEGIGELKPLFRQKG